MYEKPDQKAQHTRSRRRRRRLDQSVSRAQHILSQHMLHIRLYELDDSAIDIFSILAIVDI